MEDTQNSAPGQPTAHETAKLSTIPRRPDAQSVTKRYTYAHFLSSSSSSPDHSSSSHIISANITDFTLQPSNRVDATDALCHSRHLCVPGHSLRPSCLDRHHRWPRRDSIRIPLPQALICLPSQLPVRTSNRSVQNAHIPSQCRLLRSDMPRHSQG